MFLMADVTSPPGYQQNMHSGKGQCQQSSTPSDVEYTRGRTDESHSHSEVAIRLPPLLIEVFYSTRRIIFCTECPVWQVRAINYSSPVPCASCSSAMGTRHTSIPPKGRMLLSPLRRRSEHRNEATCGYSVTTYNHLVSEPFTVRCVLCPFLPRIGRPIPGAGGWSAQRWFLCPLSGHF